MSLARRISLLAIGAVVATAAVAAGSALLVAREAIREGAFNAVSSGSEAYAELIGLHLAGATRELEALADDDLIAARTWDGDPTHPVGATSDLPRRRAMAGVLAHGPAFESIALLRDDGRIHLVEPIEVQESASRTDLAFLPWFATARESDSAVVSDLHVSPLTHRPSVAIAVPVASPDGTRRGYVVGFLDLAVLSSLGVSGEGSAFGYLTDGQGLIVAHGRNPRYAREQTDFSLVPAVREALAGRSGAMEDHNPIEGVDRIAGFRSLAGTRWAVIYVVPTSVAYAPAGNLILSMAAATVILVLVVGGVALAVARRATRPLGRLTAAASAIAAGDTTVTLPPAGSDEVGVLAGEFRAMVTALSDREADLRRRALELEASNRELESFSYSVAHDLRAPLRAIVGFSRRVATHNADALDEETSRDLARVEAGAAQMGELIDDLLEYARLGRKDLDMRWLDPEPIVHEAFDLLRAERADREIDLVVGQMPRLRSDRVLLRQVFVNLLSNAVKFARSGGVRIEVGAKEIGGTTALFVHDDGIGFEMQYSERIFDVFERLNRAEDYPGTGVGLALVRRIVERHGGRIWAEAVPGAGATFLFTLKESAT